MHINKAVYIVVIACCCLVGLKAVAQQGDATYRAENSKKIIDSLQSVAILPPWVDLAPARYKKHVKELETNRTTGSLFLQNLLFFSLLRTDPSHEKKVVDIYSTNESLARLKVTIPELTLAMSPAAICQMLEADAVLLTLTSYNKTFLTDNPSIVQLLKPITWNGSLKRKNLIVVLFHKTGAPIWAVAMQPWKVKSTLREHEYLYVADAISLYGTNL